VRTCSTQCIEFESIPIAIVEPDPLKTMAEVETGRLCPTCGTSFQERAFFCPECGGELPDQASENGPSEPSELTDGPVIESALENEAKIESAPESDGLPDQYEGANDTSPGNVESAPANLPEESRLGAGLHRATAGVEKLRRVSSDFIDQAAYDPSLRFLAVAAFLFLLFLAIVVLSKVIA